LKKWFSSWKNAAWSLLLLYWPFHSLWYECLRRAQYQGGELWIVSSPWDRAIPFCEWFAVPYLSWYLCIAATLCYSFFSSKENFLRTVSLIYACLIPSMIFCTAFPSEMEGILRPDFSALGRENIATAWVQLIYRLDSPPRNVFPSMHVSVSWALWVAWLRMRPRSVLWKTVGFGWALLITLSTVLIKQHSILDLFSGIAVAALASVAVLWAERRWKQKKTI
jgi:membrane-associated phospholipid phosphatase